MGSEVHTPEPDPWPGPGYYFNAKDVEQCHLWGNLLLGILVNVSPIEYLRTVAQGREQLTCATVSWWSECTWRA